MQIEAILVQQENNKMETLAFIFLLISDIVYIASMFIHKKPVILVMIITSNLLFALQFLLMGGLTGCITIFIDIAYLIAIYILEHFKKEKFNIVPTLIAIVAVCISTKFSWAGNASLLPMFALITSLVATMFKSVLIIKIGAVIRNILFVIYMFLTSTTFNAVLQIVVVVGLAIGSILEYIKIKKTA